MERRIGLVAIQCLVFLALYFSTSLIAAARGIQTPWFYTSLDGRIPFLPMFVWAYISAYFLDTAGICLAVWRVNEQDFKSVLIACYINLFLFSFFHLVFPRVAAKPYVDASSASGSAMVVIQWLTTKYNNFPSGHVSYSLITAWAATRSYSRNKVLSVFLIVDAFAVIASTMLVKEHTVLDVLGGLAIALISIAVARFVTKRAPFAMVNW